MTEGETFIVIYLFAAAAVIILIDLLRRKPVPLDTLRLFSAMFVLAYLLVPALTIIYREEVLLEMDRRKIILHTYTLWTAVLVTLSYACIYTGYALGRSRMYVSVGLQESSRRIVFVLFILTAMALTLLYASQFGGIRYWITAAISARHLSEGTTRVGAIAFVYKIIQPGGTIALSVAFACLFAATKSRTTWAMIFLLAFVYFALISVVHGGRGAVIFPLIGLLIIWAGVRRRLPIKSLIIGTIVILGIVAFGKPVLAAIPLFLSGYAPEAWDRLNVLTRINDIHFYAIEFTRYTLHPSISLQAVLDNPQLRPRWFTDILIGLDSAIPSRLIGISLNHPPSAVAVNSDLLTGDPGKGLVPGQLAAWVYAFNVPGLLFVGLLWGLFMRWVNDFLLNSARAQPGFWGVYAFTTMYLALYLQLGNPNHFVSRFVVLWVIAFPLLPFLELYRRARNSNYRTPSTSLAIQQ